MADAVRAREHERLTRTVDRAVAEPGDARSVEPHRSVVVSGGRMAQGQGGPGIGGPPRGPELRGRRARGGGAVGEAGGLGSLPEVPQLPHPTTWPEERRLLG